MKSEEVIDLAILGIGEYTHQYSLTESEYYLKMYGEGIDNLIGICKDAYHSVVMNTKLDPTVAKNLKTGLIARMVTLNLLELGYGDESNLVNTITLC